MAPAVALAGAGLTIVGSLLSWASLTVLLSLTIAGTDTDEGKVTLALAVVGAVTALVALAVRDGRAMLATAFAGAVALIAELVFALRLEDSFAGSVADREDADAIGDVLEGAVSLETGWVLALLGSLLMIGAGVYATVRGRRA